ncbi:MAG: hypothetical protein HZC54_24790 [Verrucomicrobia bacterium]|nr:hypothetical protein [Verrucomicrobiota bacterium]
MKKETKKTGQRGQRCNSSETVEQEPKAAAKSEPRYKCPPETLALIAATASRGLKTPPDKAVEYAAALYDAAVMQLNEMEEETKEGAEFFENVFSGQLPDECPAPLDEFLRLVVKAKTLADGTKRFRDFLRFEVGLFREPARLEKEKPLFQVPRWMEYQPFHSPRWGWSKTLRANESDADKGAISLLAYFRQHGILSGFEWFVLTKTYETWWLNERGNKARAAAMKRLEKPLDSK